MALNWTATERGAAKIRLALKDRFMPIDRAAITLAVILLATTIMRFTVSESRPLWVDETQTGMLALQPTLRDFIHQCTYDINAPLYYLLARVWTHIAGYSNFALRFPAAICGLVAPLIALVPRTLIDRPVRFTWCALVACWIPGIWYSQEARSYTLVFMLAVANALAFANLVRRPSQGTAWAWAGLSATLILAHYFAASLVAVQGLTYLAIHKRRALFTFPAGFAFLPALVPIVIQARGLLMITGNSTSWMSLQTPWGVFRDVIFLVGNPITLISIFLWLFLLLYIHLTPNSRISEPTAKVENYLWVSAGTSLASLILIVWLGFYFRIVTERYLTVFEPGLLLGLALIAHWKAGRHLAAPALVALFAASTVEWALDYRGRVENPYNFEVASNALMTAHPTRLVFLWDTVLRLPQAQLDPFGGFFFARAGQRLTVDGVNVTGDEDPNSLLLRHAAPPGTAILWVYDRFGRGTAARRFPPRIQQLDPTWGCRNFGRYEFVVLACDRDWAAKRIVSDAIANHREDALALQHRP